MIESLDTHLIPLEEVCVDMIGPWRVSINNFKYEFRSWICIDPIIDILEVIPVENATSNAQAFKENWLSHYPTPRRYLMMIEIYFWDLAYDVKKDYGIEFM